MQLQVTEGGVEEASPVAECSAVLGPTQKMPFCALEVLQLALGGGDQEEKVETVRLS